MREQSFHDWLLREVWSARLALLGILQEKDRLLFVEAPPIRNNYMEKIGNEESKVLEAELEVFILRRKVELIQIAINRREKVDIEKINKILDEERNNKIAELENEDRTLYELPQLSDEEKDNLQRRYREIIEKFHPEMNPDVSDTQKELYYKAQDAYRKQDAEALKLIYDMLVEAIDFNKNEMQFVKPDYKINSEELKEDYNASAHSLTSDYKLAKKLYCYFKPLETDAVINDTLEKYNIKRRKLENEIESIKNSFPFNAVSTLNSKSKTEEYLTELQYRANQCEKEKSELEQKINELTQEEINA